MTNDSKIDENNSIKYVFSTQYKINFKSQFMIVKQINI